MYKKILLLVVVMLALTMVVTPVTAEKPEGEPPFGWSFTAVPQKTCFPAGDAPAFVKVDVTVNAPDKFFPLLLTFDPVLPSGVLPCPGCISREIAESGTSVVGWLAYFDGMGTTTKDYTFTITSLGQSIGKSMTETVTIKWGMCPVIGPGIEK